MAIDLLEEMSMNWTYDHDQYLERELDKRAKAQGQLQVAPTPAYSLRGKRSTRKGAA